LDETKIATGLVNGLFSAHHSLVAIMRTLWGYPPIEFRDFSHDILTRSKFARVVEIILPLGYDWWLKFEQSKLYSDLSKRVSQLTK